MHKVMFAIVLAALFLSAVGCDPLTVHKVSSTLLDGVPSLPPAEEYCNEYHKKATQDELNAAKKIKQSVAQSSSHPPYTAKRCNDCHNKDTDSGFVVEKEVLCAHCHKGFPPGAYLHGPAAVGACLKCHLPHSSNYPNLLVKPKEELCDVCHAEARLAKGLHSAVLGKNIMCTDCHNPHGGTVPFFLR